MDTLQKLGLAEDTILVFMTDNGTANGAQFGTDRLNSEAVDGFNGGMRGKKSSICEGGHRGPQPLRIEREDHPPAGPQVLLQREIGAGGIDKTVLSPWVGR